MREYPRKKVQRDELLKEEALLAARLLQGAEIELLPTRSALEAATRLAIDLDHPPYDCLYLDLALAITHHCPFVTADTLSAEARSGAAARSSGQGHIAGAGCPAMNDRAYAWSASFSPSWNSSTLFPSGSAT
jgi:hypothetical protein